MSQIRQNQQPMKKNHGKADPNDEEITELEHLRKLFIGGLAPYTTEESLKEFYEQWGKIVDVVVMRDTATKRSRGFGFITYTKAYMVDKAQDARPHVVDGKVVEAKRALPRPEREKRETNVTVKKLFVGGLKDNHDEACLEEYFQQFGNVVGVKILTDKTTGKRRGFAFIEFDDYDAVDKAILQTSHSIKYVLVDVKKSVYKLDRNKTGMIPGALNGSNMPPNVSAPPYPQQQPSMMMNTGPPMNYNGWGPVPPQNYNGYNQQPPPQMNNWNYPPVNTWNGGMPPQPPPQAQGNWNPSWSNTTGPMINCPPQQPLPQPNQPPLPPQQSQQQTTNWGSGPTIPPGQQANFGTGYQQNYGGGPTKNSTTNSNRMNPYSMPPANNYGGGNNQQQNSYVGYNNASGPTAGPGVPNMGPGGMNMQPTPGNSVPQMPGPVPPVGSSSGNRRY